MTRGKVGSLVGGEMARRDGFHHSVVKALQKDGWIITHDPLRLELRGLKLEADLGAEKFFAAEKEGRKIAVEVKDFGSESPTNVLEKTIGQLQLYQLALNDVQKERTLFLAITKDVYNNLFSTPAFTLIVEQNKINLLVFDQKQEVIVQWINQESTPTF